MSKPRNPKFGPLERCQPTWHKLSEDKPPHQGEYLVWYEEGYCLADSWLDRGFGYPRPTHWAYEPYGPREKISA
jgi:hypothetical protein